jgi:RNA methyltransferase, TrmH family
MISHNQLSKLTSLREKKFRHKHKEFIVEGEKMVSELLQQQRIVVERVYATFDFLHKNAKYLAKMGDHVVPVSANELAKISALSTPNQVVAICAIPDENSDILAENVQNSWHFYLDGIQDPGNFGTFWRLADWFGVPNLICSPTCVDAWNPKVVQATMGAFSRVAPIEIEFENLLEKLPPDVSILGAMMDGLNIFEAKNRLPKSGILVIGNEGAGISEEILQKITHKISIPRDPAGGAESLNAAVAGGILMGLLKN